MGARVVGSPFFIGVVVAARVVVGRFFTGVVLGAREVVGPSVTGVVVGACVFDAPSAYNNRLCIMQRGRAGGDPIARMDLFEKMAADVVYRCSPVQNHRAYVCIV